MGRRAVTTPCNSRQDLQFHLLVLSLRVITETVAVNSDVGGTVDVDKTDDVDGTDDIDVDRTDDIDVLYQSLLANKITIHPNGDLQLKPWGQKEFSLLDPDNNLLTFGQSI